MLTIRTNPDNQADVTVSTTSHSIPMSVHVPHVREVKAALERVKRASIHIDVMSSSQYEQYWESLELIERFINTR